MQLKYRWFDNISLCPLPDSRTAPLSYLFARLGSRLATYGPSWAIFSMTAIVDGISGAAGGIIATIVTYPLLTISTRLAVNAEGTIRARLLCPRLSLPSCTSSCGSAHPIVMQTSNRCSITCSIPPFAVATPIPGSASPLRPRLARRVGTEQRSLVSSLSQFTSASAVRSLYDGLGPSLIGTAASQGVYFYLYEIIRRLVVRSRPLRRSAKDLSGALHRRSAPPLLGPIASGHAPALERKTPPSAPPNPTHCPPPPHFPPVAETLLIAALAGCGNVLITNPIWVLVIRMQTQRAAQQRSAPAQRSPAPPNGASSETGASSSATSALDRAPRPDEKGHAGAAKRTAKEGALAAPPSAWRVLRELWVEEGVRGLWRGVLPSLLMVVNPSLQFVALEWLMKNWRRQKRRRLATRLHLQRGNIDK